MLDNVVWLWATGEQERRRYERMMLVIKVENVCVLAQTWLVASHSIDETQIEVNPMATRSLRLPDMTTKTTKGAW